MYFSEFDPLNMTEMLIKNCFNKQNSITFLKLVTFVIQNTVVKIEV